MPDDLFTPARFGRLELRNRVVMAPMTRSRAGAHDEPTELGALYYRQRASAGLIITEGTYPSEAGKGYCRTPGLVTREQIAGWQRVCEGVHAEGSTIVAQLMHCGRVCAPDNKVPGSDTVAPSAIRAEGELFTDTVGMQALAMPRALETAEVAGVVDEYRQATANAYEAGFDGVELHCTSGYLPAQFLSTGTNQRDDRYGGSVENRTRFPREVLEAMASVDGADRVGFRICPGNPFNDLHDDDPRETFEVFLGSVRGMGLAYLHVLRLYKSPLDNIALAREHFGGPLIVNDSYKPEEAKRVVADGSAQAVAFARSYIGNPDLVERLRSGAELAKFDLKTLYTPGPDGYTDYPTLGG